MSSLPASTWCVGRRAHPVSFRGGATEGDVGSAEENKRWGERKKWKRRCGVISETEKRFEQRKRRTGDSQEKKGEKVVSEEEEKGGREMGSEEKRRGGVMGGGVRRGRDRRDG